MSQGENNMAVDKACPVVLRHTTELEVLAFRHPLAGLQLVKGTVEAWFRSPASE